MNSLNSVNNFIHKTILKRNLKNTDFSLIANNCTGAFILHDLHQQFRSPFVNLWLTPKDFLKYLQNMDYYMSCPLSFLDNTDYPIGLLDDIKIYFQHYSTNEEAAEKWVERTKRINKDNLFILFAEHDNCTYDDLLEFDKLPYKNKIALTHKLYPEIKSAYRLKGFEENGEVGNLYEFINSYSGKKYYDQFPYVKWFNGCNIQQGH